MIEIDKRSTYIGRMQLLWKKGAITGHNGTYARFHDWEGYSTIDRIVFEYMNKNVLVLRGDELQMYTFAFKNNKYRTREARNRHGDLTEYERNVLDTGSEATSPGVWCITDLQVP